MLYFIRHGKTDYNLNNLLAGRCDIGLNEEGFYQAKEAKLDSKKIELYLIFCSPLLRAKQTCLIINEEHNAPVIIKDELIERDFKLYEGKQYSCINGDEAWNYYLDAYEGELETIKEVFERVYKFLDEIKDKYKEKNILIVAHNDIGRAIHCYFNGIPEDGNLRNLSMPNAKIIKYNFKENKKRI